MSSSHVTASLAQGTLVAGKYRLQRLLGEGAMGVVWSARNEVTSGQVALKLILGPGPELRLRLLREAQACCQIQHKNVIQIHDVGQTDSGDPFLVMELLMGETLADLLARKRRLNQREAAVIGRDVARALSAAHDKGIVHRDLKPANIFLHNQPGEDARVVKVLDFGVSKNLLAADGLQTMMGGAIGSPSYMSPEQARGARDIDARADIWSLGVLLFEMLTGERPFLGEAREVLSSILEAEIPAVSRRVRGLDPGLERLISSCLTRDRELRIWPIADVASGLDPFTEGAVRSTTPTLTAVWGVAPTIAAPPASRPREHSIPSAPLLPEVESEAETQKLDAGNMAVFTAPAPRPVSPAVPAASSVYDPTVRMFPAAPLPAAAGARPPPPLPAVSAATPPPLPSLPPPLPAPSVPFLLLRDASPMPVVVAPRPARQGARIAARGLVALVVAAAVLLLAITFRDPRSEAVAASIPAAVVEATTVVDSPRSTPPAPATPPPVLEEAVIPARNTPSAIAVVEATPPVDPPKPSIVPRVRPRVESPKQLPPCGRFVKTGCDDSPRP